MKKLLLTVLTLAILLTTAIALNPNDTNENAGGGTDDGYVDNAGKVTPGT